MAAGVAADKSPTAKDFADITELAEEAEGATPLSSQMERQGFEKGEGRDALFRKGMAFAQSLPGGSGPSAVSMETDDYDDDSEEVPGSQSLPSNTNEEELSLSQQPDSGYESLPLSDPASSLDPSDHTPQVTAASEATPTSLSKPEGEEGGKDGGKIESAIPYLIPKDMTLEQLHAKVHTHTCTHTPVYCGEIQTPLDTNSDFILGQLLVYCLLSQFWLQMLRLVSLSIPIKMCNFLLPPHM